MEIIVAGTSIMLLPERAIYLPQHNALVVADLHWGKAAAFRAAFVPIPTGTTANDLTRLTQALNRTGASQLVVLGDLLHARAGRHHDTFEVARAWREQHAQVAITLIRGNHDAHAGDPPRSLRITCTDEPIVLGPFRGIHHAVPSPDGYVLGGHLHPCVTMRGRGRQSVRLPCFVFGTQVGILPAFSSFTGGGMYEHQDGDALYGIAGDEIIAIGRPSAHVRVDRR